MKPILEINKISKKFRIYSKQQPYLSLRDSLMSIFSSNTYEQNEFYALKDVSFNVFPGDTIGIIGKNGAGKSTFLKILSKITPPTSGKIICRGRIASLLEVGTGFHPELSGRENVFLNGSILGMKRFEILKNFDAIVDFAGVERFLDTPLKHYSSGMQLRLAFAVAAFLENEILIIDEVLAVGDAEFQKKCMGKMEDVSKSGKTILFVSHNLGAVNSLCKESVLLKSGELLAKDTTSAIIEKYLSSSEKKYEYINPSSIKDIYFEQIQLENAQQNKVNEFGYSDKIIVCLTIRLTNVISAFKVGIALLDNNKVKIFTHHYDIKDNNMDVIYLKCYIPDKTVCPGSYSLDIAAFIPNVILYDYVNDVCAFKMLETGSDMYFDADYGKLFIQCEWVQVKN